MESEGTSGQQQQLVQMVFLSNEQREEYDHGVSVSAGSRGRSLLLLLQVEGSSVAFKFCTAGEQL